MTCTRFSAALHALCCASASRPVSCLAWPTSLVTKASLTHLQAAESRTQHSCCLQDNKGNSPLHYSAGYGRPMLVEPLLKAGADGKAVNGTGHTPYQLLQCASLLLFALCSLMPCIPRSC